MGATEYRGEGGPLNILSGRVLGVVGILEQNDR